MRRCAIGLISLHGGKNEISDARLVGSLFSSKNTDRMRNVRTGIAFAAALKLLVLSGAKRCFQFARKSPIHRSRIARSRCSILVKAIPIPSVRAETTRPEAPTFAPAWTMVIWTFAPRFKGVAVGTKQPCMLRLLVWADVWRSERISVTTITATNGFRNSRGR
jgi:hypothetical protein